MATKPNKVNRPWVPERKAFEREKRDDSFYNGRPWRKVSKANLAANPICKHCEAKDITTKATHSDHIVPIERGGAKYDLNNIQSLCASCHNSKSAGERSGIGVKSRRF